MNKIYNCILLVCFLRVISIHNAEAATAKVVVKNLRVEYTETPLGVDEEKPRFSWQMSVEGEERGYSQKAFQLTLYDEKGKPVWDSGKKETGVSLNIRYAGTPLQPATRYEWVVKVWDRHGRATTANSWFETGLMNHLPVGEGWNNARWIGGGTEDKVLYSHYLPVFRLSFSLRFDRVSRSARAGFMYGANDERLMSRNKNMYSLENRKNESYVKVELDMTPLDRNGQAVMNIYRVGFHPDDKKDIPYYRISVPRHLMNEDNRYEKHTVHLSSNLGFTCFYLDQTEIGSVNLNPLGRGGDFIAFPMVGDLGLDIPKGQSVAFSDVTVSDFRTPSATIARVKKLDGLKGENKEGFTCFVNPDQNAMPMLRTVFSSRGKAVKARLYVTARGIYEMYVNGKRIGNDYFNPGMTQYNKTHLYQTFDVTDCIRPGKNAMGAWLAEGWWSGGATYMGENWNYFGDRQSLLAKLVLTYADGTKEVIVTNPATWQYFNEGPVVYGSFFQGEVYDASKEKAIEGWSTPAYDASCWKPAQEVELRECVSREGWGNGPAADDYSEYQLTGQAGPTVKAVEELTALSVEEVRPGVYVYDMGRNMVGVPKIALQGMQPGTRICLRFAEVKYPDLPEYAGHEGMIMLENIRAAMAQDLYVTRGGAETILPRFTFHGYRFLEITGIDTPLPPEAVKGVVLSSIDTPGACYETSNPKVNQLWKNITRSAYGNFLSIPTDCPQRNERLGWAGDISVFSRTAVYLWNASQFLRRYMRAMRDVQRADGRFPDIAPLGGGFGGMLWGSAGITVAWECYCQYGDTVLLEEHYDAMKHYIHYLLEKTIDPVTGLLVQENVWGNLGDWLGPEDNKNDKSLLWEAYFIYDLELMRKMATVLNKEADANRYQKLSKERKEHFVKVYIRPEDGKTVSSGYNGAKPGRLADTQTSYVLPLVFKLLDRDMQKRVAANLAETVGRENVTDDGKQCPSYSLMTGFIGTAWISKALSDNGFNEEAYRLLQQTAYPSWLYSVEQGATTIWERLNSYTRTDGFGGNNRMNSFNHYSFGAVGAWMCNYSLGIRRDEEFPGFKRFILQPVTDPTGEMTFAKGYYDSVYGRIESGWRVEKGITCYDFIVPANTTAFLYLPGNSVKEIKESGKYIDRNSSGIEYVGQKEGNVSFLLQSGKYSFEVKSK